MSGHRLTPGIACQYQVQLAIDHEVVPLCSIVFQRKAEHGIRHLHID